MTARGLLATPPVFRLRMGELGTCEARIRVRTTSGGLPQEDGTYLTFFNCRRPARRVPRGKLPEPATNGRLSLFSLDERGDPTGYDFPLQVPQRAQADFFVPGTRFACPLHGLLHALLSLGTCVTHDECRDFVHFPGIGDACFLAHKHDHAYLLGLGSE